MPLYEFDCPAGHRTERLASRDTEVVYCACGEPARRQTVYRVSPPPRMFQARDFDLTPEMRQLNEDALGHKHEAMKTLADARANGWRPD